MLLLSGIWTIGLALRPPKQPIYQGVEKAAALSEDGRVLSIGLVDDVAAYYATPFKLSLQPTGILGADLGNLQDAPNVALILYPDLIPEDVYERLHAGSFVEVARFHGWLDWDYGDVLLMQR